MLLSVDPGLASGWALWQDGCLLEVGTLRLHAIVSEHHSLLCLDHLESLLDDWAGVHVIVEDQYYIPPKHHGRYRSAPFEAVKELIETKCAWQNAAGHLGARVHPAADPRKWIPAVSSGIPIKATGQRLWYLCAQRYPGEARNEDEAAAIMLGTWFMREQRREQCL